jgi:hypothetical protein
MRLRFGIAFLSCTLAVAAACSSADSAPAGDGPTLHEGTSEADLSGANHPRQGDLGLNPCAVVLCPADTTCEVVDGEATCTPLGAASCAAVLCLEGTECVERDGRAECVPQGPTSCAAVTCLEGNECVERDGRAECVPAENPCNLTDCRSGFVCELQNGEAVCVPAGNPEVTCASVLCIVGTVCEETANGPECVPQAELCGGFAGIPCDAGETCIDDPSDDCDPDNGGADCGGVCIPEQPKQFCGGFANIQCPGAGSCVDDASDGCDPDNGGADCGGVCECNVRALCVPGLTFDPSPEVCACVEQPVNDPCAAVRCRSGFHCEADDGRAECVPNQCSAD